MPPITEAHGGRLPASGYAVARAGTIPQVIGFASTELKDYGSLHWHVISAQNADEAFAAVKPLVRLLVLMSVLGLASVTLFGVYVYFHQRLPYEHLGRLTKPAHT